MPRKALDRHRPLMLFTFAKVAFVPTTGLAALVDDHTLDGAPIWFKPSEFAVSFALPGVTLSVAGLSVGFLTPAPTPDQVEDIFALTLRQSPRGQAVTSPDAPTLLVLVAPLAVIGFGVARALKPTPVAVTA